MHSSGTRSSLSTPNDPHYAPRSKLGWAASFLPRSAHVRPRTITHRRMPAGRARVCGMTPPPPQQKIHRHPKLSRPPPMTRRGVGGAKVPNRATAEGGMQSSTDPRLLCRSSARLAVLLHTANLAAASVQEAAKSRGGASTWQDGRRFRRGQPANMQKSARADKTRRDEPRSRGHHTCAMMRTHSSN